MSALDGSIVIISLPAIFRGIHLDPLAPANIGYLLWMIMGYRLVQSVLVVTLGRIGDMFGRVRVYNSGFTVFTVASILLSFDPFAGAAAAQWLIGWRLLQAIGGSMLTANSAAILTDAFPPDRRGFALGFNQVAALAGQFIGLVAGGSAGRVGLAGGVLGQRARRSLRHDLGLPQAARQRRAAPRPDRLVGQHHVRRRAVARFWSRSPSGMQPHGGHTTGWQSPFVLATLVAGIVLLIAFVLIESRVAEPMIRLSLFRIRAFSAGNAAHSRGGTGAGWPAVHADHLAAGHLAAAARLRLRRHPAVGGHLPAAADGRLPCRRPTAGTLSDRFGARGIASAGMLLFGAELRRTAAAADRLPVLGVRNVDRAQRHRQRHVRRAEHLGDHGQRAAQRAWCGVGHARDVPEQRHRAVHRGVLLADGRRPVRAACPTR